MDGGYGRNSSSSSSSGSKTIFSDKNGSSGSSGKGSAGKYTKYINIALAVLAIVILLFLIGSYYNHKKNGTGAEESFSNPQGLGTTGGSQRAWRPGPSEGSIKSSQHANDVMPSMPLGKNEIFSSDPASATEETHRDAPHASPGNQYPTDTYPKDTLSSAELLPRDPNSKWAQVNPSGQGELGDQNFLEAAFHIGTNTIGQSLRNPNLQLRSEPPCPQMKVSPWMQSTMEPDINRKGLEIGGGC